MKISEERKNDAIISWRKITSYRNNVRDLGGYETQEGYYTKSHKYVRSTCPSGISDDLKEQFYQYGIRTVIDLRSDYEKQDIIEDILGLIIPETRDMFACEMIATKAISIAKERIKALEHKGFCLSEESVIGHDGTKYNSYYFREV